MQWIYLSNFTKRNLYEQYCYGRGWASKADNKGRYPKLQDFPKRKKDDVLWGNDMDTEEIVSWWSFRHIWREDLPNIHIRAPCNDKFGECTILHNAFRYRERRQQTSEDSDESDNDKLEDERGNDNERHADFKEGEDEVSNLTKSLLTSDCIRQKAVLEAAGFRVTQSRAILGMVQYRAREAIESLIELKRHDTRERVLVCDYAQNINYPHYGG
jgi:hypothetical protein